MSPEAPLLLLLALLLCALFVVAISSFVHVHVMEARSRPIAPCPEPLHPRVSDDDGRAPPPREEEEDVADHLTVNLLRPIREGIHAIRALADDLRARSAEAEAAAPAPMAAAPAPGRVPAHAFGTGDLGEIIAIADRVTSVVEGYKLPPRVGRELGSRSAAAAPVSTPPATPIMSSPLPSGGTAGRDSEAAPCAASTSAASSPAPGSSLSSPLPLLPFRSAPRSPSSSVVSPAPAPRPWERGVGESPVRSPPASKSATGGTRPGASSALLLAPPSPPRRKGVPPVVAPTSESASSSSPVYHYVDRDERDEEDCPYDMGFEHEFLRPKRLEQRRLIRARAPRSSTGEGPMKHEELLALLRSLTAASAVASAALPSASTTTSTTAVSGTPAKGPSPGGGVVVGGFSTPSAPPAVGPASRHASSPAAGGIAPRTTAAKGTVTDASAVLLAAAALTPSPPKSLAGFPVVATAPASPAHRRPRVGSGAAVAVVPPPAFLGPGESPFVDRKASPRGGTGGSAALPSFDTAFGDGADGSSAQGGVRPYAGMVARRLLAGPGGSGGSGAGKGEAPPVAFGLHVLVVDDEKVNRKVASRMLDRLGCTWDAIDDGDLVGPALAFSERAYDVILLDILMERSNGIEVCVCVRFSLGCVFTISAPRASPTRTPTRMSPPPFLPPLPFPPRCAAPSATSTSTSPSSPRRPTSPRGRPPFTGPPASPACCRSPLPSGTSPTS
jgi:hypothetical protein